MNKIIIWILLLCSSPSLTAQTKLNATLTDAETGEPVAGATIQLAGRNIGSISTGKGQFVIDFFEEADSLLISHGLYQALRWPLTSRAVGGSTIIYLRRNYRSLDAVEVSTGLQVIAKERATGSFDKINASRLNEQVSTDVLSRLENIGSGIYMDKKTSALNPAMSIRGLSSINGPRSPLIILDNFPYEGNLNNINPNDVESITILKDAAAASIWGTRAGNGVIVITTKKAKFNQRLSISLNNNITYSQQPDLFYDKKISSSDLIDVEQYLYGRGYYNSSINSSSKPVLSPVVELLVKKANGSMPPAEADAAIDFYRNTDTRNDLKNYLYQTGVNRQHALSMSAGNAIMSWNASAGIDQNINNLAAGYNRATLKTEQRIQLHKKLQLQTGIMFTSSKAVSGRPGYGDISTSSGDLPGYVLLANEEGAAIPVMRTYRQSYLDTVGSGKLLNWNYYPLEDYKYNNNSSRVTDILATAGLQYEILKGLSAQVMYQYQQQISRDRFLQGAGSYAARDLVNGASSINYTTGVVSYTIPRGGILTNSSSVLKSQNFRGQLNFNRRFKQHAIDAIAGADIRELHTTGESFKVYGYNDDILTSGNVDYSRSYRHFINGGNLFIPSGVGFSDKLNRFVSFYGNTAYTFKQRYTLSASARRDASNLFGVSTNNKWTPLWSTGAAWDISRENFYKIRWLDFLKLRVTYGLSGNADPARSAYTTIQYLNPHPYTQEPGARIDQYKNPSLRWEQTAMLNMGIDFRTINNRISGSVEYYHKKSTDLLANTRVDYTAVATPTLTKNVAAMKGSGWDIVLNSRNTNGQIEWETNLLWSMNTDKVTKYFVANENGSSYVGTGTSINAFIGRPVYSLYSYRWAGLDALTGDPMGYNADTVTKNYTLLTGTATQIGDLVYHGRALPKIFGSMGNTLRWKSISLTARITYKFGYYFRLNAIRYSELYSSYRAPAEFADRWQQPGDELNTHVPSMVYPVNVRRDNFYSNSELLVQRADHIRLQYLSASYNLPAPLLGRSRIRSAQLYFNINNIGILWRANTAGIDPDYRNSSLPPGRTFAMGANLNF
jgi:TonB-linked SusC/RagA family outer membrane protein